MTQQELATLINETRCYGCFGASLPEMLRLGLLARLDANIQNLRSQSGPFVRTMNTQQAVNVIGPTTLWSFTLPGGTLGQNGFAELEVMYSDNTTGGTFIDLMVGVQQIMHRFTPPGGGGYGTFRRTFVCRNSNTAKLTRQTGVGDDSNYSNFFGSGNAFTAYNLDTSVDQVVNLVVTLPFLPTTVTIESAIFKGYYRP